MNAKITRSAHGSFVTVTLVSNDVAVDGVGLNAAVDAPEPEHAVVVVGAAGAAVVGPVGAVAADVAVASPGGRVDVEVDGDDGRAAWVVPLAHPATSAAANRTQTA